MTTLEPLTEAELNELQAQWMNGNRERRQYRREDPLAEDWTEQPALADALLGITGPLTEEQERDLDTYYRYVRHTIQITRQPMSVEDEPIAYVSPWKWLVLLAVAVAFYGGCCVAYWLVTHK